MNVFDVVNSLSRFKDTEFNENDSEMEKIYLPFIVNRSFSYYPDTIIHANEMNSKSFLPKRMQHDYYKYSLRPRKRFSKWLKKDKDSDLELVQNYFNFSKKKAIEALSILTKENLLSIKAEMDEGGA